MFALIHLMETNVTLHCILLYGWDKVTLLQCTLLKGKYEKMHLLERQLSWQRYKISIDWILM